MNNEAQFTSTVVKLMKNYDEAWKTGKFKPIHAEISLTNACQLNCSFCSVANRDKTLVMDWNVLQACLNDLKELGCKAVSFTGGGDPCLYPRINEAICLAFYLGFDVGLITNGIALQNIDIHVLDNLTWLRVSLSVVDTLGGGNAQYDFSIPTDRSFDLGFSYVWSSDTDPSMLQTIEDHASYDNASYLRIVPNCLNTEEIQKVRALMPEVLKKSTFEGTFFQSKDYSKPKECWWGYLKPFIYTDGRVFMCSANPLINRDFAKSHELGHVEDLKVIWEYPEAFDTTPCGTCFFKEQQEFLKSLMTKDRHEAFI